MENKIFCLLICIVLFFSTGVILVPGEAGAANKHALLIAVSDYQGTGGLHSLMGTHNDVDLMEKVLSDERFGFAGNITVLKDNQASRSRLKQEFLTLNNRIRPGDIVYIHYSGHGSFTEDKNEDSEEFDQTWVTFDSRRDNVNEHDRYDVLDDELNEWLVPLFDKAAQVILVSDSCHSASVTRGQVSELVRAAPEDKRIHPLAEHIFNNKNLSRGVIIGAARDVEQAGEFENDNKENYGLFTWFWGQALNESKPGETWRDLFKKASIQVSNWRQAQNPQIQGEMADDPVFAGNFTAAKPRIVVKEVIDSDKGQKAIITAGSLVGVTSGSTYRLFDPTTKDKEKLTMLTITTVDTFFSHGTVSSGILKAGDLMVEENHAFSIKPFPVAITGDFITGKDNELISFLRSQISQDRISGYTLADKKDSAKMVLYVVRPKTENGKKLYESGEILPAKDENASPEVWVLTDTLSLWNEQLQIPFSDQEKGMISLKKNLEKIARIREIKQLDSGVVPEVGLGTIIWEKTDFCEETSEACLVIPLQHKLYFSKVAHPESMPYFTMSQMSDTILHKDQIMTFVLMNKSKHKNLYAYLLNLGSQGEINVIFPPVARIAESALIKAGETISTEDVEKKNIFAALGIGEPGEETVKFIVSESPIDVTLLKQDSFSATRGSSKGEGMLGLGHLLSGAAKGTTRGFAVKIDPVQWGVLQYSSTVK